MRTEQIKAECRDYFNSNTIWRRLLKGFWVKYQSYGKFAGTVKLRGLTFSEIESLEGFLGRNYHGRNSVSISAKEFENALGGSRFASLTAEEVLALFYGDNMQSKKEAENEYRKACDALVDGLKVKYADTYAADMLNEIPDFLRASMPGHLSKREQDEILKDWSETLQLASEIYNRLPYRDGNTVYLPVFATIITGNPHAFDANTPKGRLLYKIAEMDVKKRDISICESEVFASHRKQSIYLTVGILVDGISNYVTLYGVHAQIRGGALHPGTEGFCQRHEIMQIPLSVLAGWESIICPENRIVVVENPSIFAILCDNSKGNEAYMCMNGQPRLAGLKALDLLANSGTEVSYGGDFDPEGVLIAQKLSEYYNGELKFYHMSAQDYMHAISDVDISQSRLKKLDKVHNPELVAVAELIKEKKKAGYQEQLVLV